MAEQDRVWAEQRDHLIAERDEALRQIDRLNDDAAQTTPVATLVEIVAERDEALRRVKEMETVVAAAREFWDDAGGADAIGRALKALDEGGEDG